MTPNNGGKGNQVHQNSPQGDQAAHKNAIFTPNADAKIEFLALFCYRYTMFQLCATLGAHFTMIGNAQTTAGRTHWAQTEVIGFLGNFARMAQNGCSKGFEGLVISEYLLPGVPITLTTNTLAKISAKVLAKILAVKALMANKTETEVISTPRNP